MGDQDAGPAAAASGGSGTDDRATVRRELARLTEFARSLRLDDLRSGAWFAAIVKYSLDSYVAESDAASLAARYPGLDVEQAVLARIAAAARRASIEGGISAGAYTGAVAATISTGGGASPVTLPAASASFVLDLLYMSSLQLRLTHDMATLYQVPLDLTDSEDLWKLIRVAFAIKAGETGRQALGKTIPALIGPSLGRIAGGTQLAARNLPALGRYLLRRHLLKFALPAAGVPVAMAINHWSARTAGNGAATVFRAEGRVVAAGRSLAASAVDPAELLSVLWLVVKADALISGNERLLLKTVAALVGDPDSELTALVRLDASRRHGFDPGVALASSDPAALYQAGVVTAAVDGKVNVNELAALEALARSCSMRFDEAAVRALAKTFAAQG